MSSEDNREWWPSYHLVTAGQNFLRGMDGVAVDFAKAAKYFTQAAQIGDACGTYYLALMHQTGMGLPRNLALGHAMHLQAASQDPIKEYIKGSGKFLRNFGVAEACSVVGLAYELGGVEGVNVDLRKALDWYSKAVECGYFDSAFLIAKIFLDGAAPGLSSSFAIGVEYMKLAAHLNVRPALKACAQAFFDFEIFSDAQEWFHFAVFHGCEDLELRRTDFVRDENIQRNFDPEKFAADLEDEVWQSHVVGPVVKKIDDFHKNLTQLLININ